MKSFASNLFIIFIFLFQSTILFSQNKPNPPLLDEVIDAFEKKTELLLNNESQFRLTYSRLPGEKITTVQHSERIFNPIECVLAKRKMDFFVQWRFVNPKPQKTVPGIVFQDSDLPRIAVLRNGSSLNWDKSSSNTLVLAARKDSDLLQHWDYLLFCGFNPFHHIAKASLCDYADYIHTKDMAFEMVFSDPLLPDSIKNNKSEYNFLKDQEIVDGFPCWVIECRGIEKLWVDVNNLSILRKRSFTFGQGKPVKFMIHNSDWVEVRKDIFLPKKQTVDWYGDIRFEKEEYWNKVTWRTVFELNEVIFDSSVDQCFEVELPVGQNVYDDRTEENYTVSDPNADPFAGAIAQGIELLNKQHRFYMIRSLCVIAGSIMILIAVILWARKQDKHNAQKPSDHDKT
ncbi:MAG: outer membrane lipoprotein-sorting protein [Planctomycetaceae bacterium]|jgi:hypothetical protein|nr:outer membrane lipoprotein-sorting protein [Planctomycetaceae bacterium]